MTILRTIKDYFLLISFVFLISDCGAVTYSAHSALLLRETGTITLNRRDILKAIRENVNGTSNVKGGALVANFDQVSDA